MNYVLDTCVISEYRKKKPNSRLMRWVDEQDEWHLFLSVLTLAEIKQGIVRLNDESQIDLLMRWLNEDLVGRFQHRIIPVSEQIAISWGELRGNAQKKGKSLPVVDSLIAATAMCYDAAVVTRNVADFQLCGSEVVNPWV